MNVIVDDIGTVVAAMRTDTVLIAALTSGLAALSSKGYDAEMPFYMYGHRLEISNRLTEKTADKIFKYKKYPLVALRLDIPEGVAGGMIEYKLNVALLMLTEKNYTAEERYANVLKPILYPMYASLFRKLKWAGFSWDGGFEPPHSKIDRPFWGTSGPEGNQANIFTDPLDAIELLDLTIRKRSKGC